VHPLGVACHCLACARLLRPDEMGEWPMGELNKAIKAARTSATKHDAVGLENALESLVRCAETIRPGGTKRLVSEAMHKLQEETCDAVREIGDLLSSKVGVTPSRELSSAGRLEALATLDTVFFSLVYALRSSGKEEAPSIIDHFAEASPGLLGKEGKLAWREFKKRHMTKGYLNRLKRRWKGDSLPNECALPCPAHPSTENGMKRFTIQAFREGRNCSAQAACAPCCKVPRVPPLFVAAGGARGQELAEPNESEEEAPEEDANQP